MGRSPSEVSEGEGMEASSGKHAVYAVQVITGEDDPEGKGLKISQSALTVPLGPGHSSAEGILFIDPKIVQKKYLLQVNPQHKLNIWHHLWTYFIYPKRSAVKCGGPGIKCLLCLRC